MASLKPYLISLAAGILVGVVYGLLKVRSPAPPVIALVGLAGILIGEQIVPIAKRAMTRPELSRFMKQDCRRHIMGELPSNQACPPVEEDQA